MKKSKSDLIKNLEILRNTVMSDINYCELNIASESFFFNEDEIKNNFESRAALLNSKNDLEFILKRLNELLNE